MDNGLQLYVQLEHCLMSELFFVHLLLKLTIQQDGCWSNDNQQDFRLMYYLLQYAV